MSRTKTSATVESTTATQPPQEPPKCTGCGHELTWRDRFYVPAPKPEPKPESATEDAAAATTTGKPKRKKKQAAETPIADAAPTLCKRCHQRNWHARLGIGAFHPATRTVTQGKQQVEVAVTANRATLRQQWRQARIPLPPLQKTRRPTRAERRAATRAKAVA